MSIASMCDRFTATLKRQESTRSVDGFVSLGYSTDGRQGLPISVRCEMQTMNADERVEFGITDSDIYWCMYSASDPVLNTKDAVEWTDGTNIQRFCLIYNPSYPMAGRNRIWKTVLREKRNRE